MHSPVDLGCSGECSVLWASHRLELVAILCVEAVAKFCRSKDGRSDTRREISGEDLARLAQGIDVVVAVLLPGSAHKACIMAISSGEPLKSTTRIRQRQNEREQRE